MIHFLTEQWAQNSQKTLIGFFAIFIVFWLWRGLRYVSRTGRSHETMLAHFHDLHAKTQNLSDTQQQLIGGINHVVETHSSAHSHLLKYMESRLAEVHQLIGKNLQQSAVHTAKTLGDLQQRLQTIDIAQANITRLSGDVLSLQDILANKQTRGSLGEIQLYDIVTKALPPDSYQFQVTLSNNKRADCIIYLPDPPGPTVIDSKFPLESYEMLQQAKNKVEKDIAARNFRKVMRTHIQAISEKYILEGETADGALMFLPSEAVYAELHSHFPEIIQESFSARVWIVSPTTCMATLNTMRAILKDSYMHANAAQIRNELAFLISDIHRLVERVGSLDRHFQQARKDIDDIMISANKSKRRAQKLDSFEFDLFEEHIPTQHPANKNISC